MTEYERFFANVDPQANGCWHWTGRLYGGYGSFYLWGKGTGAHRAAYELLVGAIPEGLTLDHLCHTNDLDCAGGPTCLHRACVNPDHLEPVPSSENTRRGRPLHQTHCVNGHEFTPDNTYLRYGGERICRQCQLAFQRAYYWRVKERLGREPAIRFVEELGPLLRSERERRGLSLREAQRDSGIPFNTIRRIENGRPTTTRNIERVLSWAEHSQGEAE